MEGKENKKSRLSALWGYTEHFRLPLLISFLLMAAELVLSFISPLVLSVTIDSVLGSQPLNTPWYFSWFVYAAGGLEIIKKNLWIMGLAMVALQLVAGVIRLARAVCNSLAGEGVVKKLRDRIYSHVQRLPFAWHAQSQTGDIIQRSTNDVDTIRRFVSAMLLEFVRTIIMLVIGVFVMLSLNRPLTYVTCAMIIPIALTSTLFFRRIHKLSVIQEEAEGNLFTVIQENLTGTRVVRAFGRERFEMEKFNARNEENRRKSLDVNNVFAGLWTTLDLLCGIEIALINILGVYFCVKGDLTIGQFTAFSSYVFLFFWPLRGFGRVLNSFSRTLVATGRIQEVLNAKEEDGLDSGLTPDMSGDIVFDHVNFAYDSTPVLRDFSMTIKGGSTVAILGGTGSGKSTVSLLLQRLYDPQSGEISIGGVNVQDIKKTYLRDKISIVLQEPFLYSKTIMQNIGIKMSKPDPDVIYAAARDACIDEDIRSFEDGYDTVVGERGVTLSGGQKQRVAIARALVGDSNMLIFDDSLSAVDTRTDAAIRDALSTRRAGVTTMIISHRTTTLMEADKIYVMKDGHIVEQGSHSELMAAGGIYQRTYEIQNAGIGGEQV